jgi:dTDP-4-dehydrorhamnose 3,5-epimerase
MPVNTPLPSGVEIVAIERLPDARGSFTEVYREAWLPHLRPVQWSVMQTHAGTFRGVHVHIRHTDLLVQVSGRLGLGLQDLRQASPTAGLAVYTEIAPPLGIVIPPGVAHGLYFPEESLQLLGVSHYWDPADDLACRWDDPEVEVSWPFTAPLLSERDARGTLREMRAGLSPHQASFATRQVTGVTASG